MLEFAVRKPDVPDSIIAPPDEELVLVTRATGFQIYVCRSAPGEAPAWVLKAPDATLLDQQGHVIGKHFGGPTWRHNDASEITARMAGKADAPEPDAIPWLLLKVTGHSGNGAFSRVTTIQRINTIGGLAPAAGCTQTNSEAEHKSSYSADYYFYARPE